MSIPKRMNNNAKCVGVPNLHAVRFESFDSSNKNSHI